MFKLGEMQQLTVDHISKIGPYLKNTDDNSEKPDVILLPKKEMPHGLKTGEKLTVFVYRDSQDRLIATIRTPKIELGQLRPLKVVAVTKIGAFLDWGLEKDLLLPFHEQTVRVQIGKQYLVALYLDKSDRLCATMRIYHRLEPETPYHVGDWVTGYVYHINPEIGAFLAVDYKYHGMIPRRELLPEVKTGQTIKARVTQIRKRDHRIVLSPTKQGYKEINPDGAIILHKMKAAGGSLPYHDKSSPAAIKREFGISKAAFKRAIGHLQKRGKITIASDGIYLNKNQ